MKSKAEAADFQDWLGLMNRALSVAAEGITIADARLPGRPLIYVNEGFERLTGYTAESALNRNCKFLQGADTDPETAETIRSALKEETECTVEILNYRKDGTPFWNRLSITPVRDADGGLTHYIGVQSDVTKRREAEAGLRRAKDELEQVNLLLRQDLEAAAEIQQSWLPATIPEVPGFAFAWSFRPCQELGGDSLNIMQFDDDHIGFYVLDVSGHGVPAALYSASVSRMLSPFPEQSTLFEPSPAGGYDFVAPADVAKALNRRLSFDPKTRRFFTMIYGILNIKTRVLHYVTAGHPPPLRFGPGGAVSCPAADGLPVGIVEEFPYREATLELAPGDRLLFFTDGAFETVDDQDRDYGIDRLLEDLRIESEASADVCLERIISRIVDWNAGDELEDDVTLLAIDVLDDD